MFEGIEIGFDVGAGGALIGLLATFVVLIIVVVSALFILRNMLQARHEYKRTFDTVLLLVLLPQMSAEQKTGGGGGGEVSLQQLQEKVSAMEAFLGTLAGLKAEKGFKTWLFGLTEVFSCELVVNDGKISFYLSCPRHMQQLIEEQVVAQFQDAVVEPVSDYNIFSPKSVVFGKQLSFKREYFFPIKTYKKLETDPLNPLINALGQVKEEDGAAIQIVFRSAPGSWHEMGPKIASKMQQGKKLKDALKDVRGGLLSGFGKEAGAMLSATKPDAQPQQTYQLSPMEQELVKGLEEKSGKSGVEATIRVIAASENSTTAQSYINNIISAFSQYNMHQAGNTFSDKTPKQKRFINDFIYRNFDHKSNVVINTEELTSLFHFPLPSITEHSAIHWLEARQAPPPLNLPDDGVIFGKSVYRGVTKVVRMTRKDRQRHVYCIGKSGTGKSYAMANVIIQDIKNGEGVCVMDPHGDLANAVIAHIPKERAEDVIYFDPSDVERPMGLNMLEFEKPEQKTFVINELMNIFDKLYDLRSTGGPMFEQYFRNAVQLIMEDPESGSTIMEVPRVLADEEYRAFKLSKTKNPTVKDFWEKEAQKAGGEASLANMVPYITSKLTQFISNDFMRPIIAQQESSFSFREVMDQKKILLCNLSKGKIGDMNSDLLGMLIIGKLLGAALSRVDTPEEERNDFYLYIDEFQNYLTEGISIILSEARKYKLCLYIAHQFIGQLVKNNDTNIRDAIFGNVGTMMAYRVGVDDTETLAKQFAPVFSEYDILNVPARTAFLKMLIHGSEPPAFNVKIPARDDPEHPEIAEALKELSRLKYGRDRDIIEEEILERAQVSY
jgi:hypothetical protein